MYTSGFPIEGIGIRLESGPQIYSTGFPIESKGIRLESGHSIGQPSKSITRSPVTRLAYLIFLMSTLQQCNKN